MPPQRLGRASPPLLVAGLVVAHAWAVSAAQSPALAPVVEIEEEVYRYEPANNGAGPLWCSGSTCLVRAGNDLFASGLETLQDLKPLNNCRWVLFKREAAGWQVQQRDLEGRTREPSPLVGFPDGRLCLSANPTLTPTNTYAGPAQPEVLEFAAGLTTRTPQRLLPIWEGKPEFTEHSYRSFAADGPGSEVILFQNIGYTHAEWTFKDRSGKWSAQGKLAWPAGKEYPKPEPIRVCYPNVALKNRAVYFCGVSDITEPYPEWRAFKKQLTGQEWDYDFRRLFFTWTPDITKTKFHEWIEIASRDKTCGWISPGDLWVAPDGAVHLVWSERALDERLRAKFFPGSRQSHAINYAVVRDGKVERRQTLLLAEEGTPALVPSAPRFQVTPEDRLFLVCHVRGTSADGKPVSENRVIEIRAGGELGPFVSVPLKQPFVSYFTSTVRGGAPPSRVLEMFGQREGAAQALSYARVRLW
jgi:hypothetical protein